VVEVDRLTFPNIMTTKTYFLSLAMVAFSLPAAASSITITDGTFDVINNEVNPAPVALTNTSSGYIFTPDFGLGQNFTKSNATGPTKGDLPGWVVNVPSSDTSGGVELLGSSYIGKGTSSGLAGYVVNNGNLTPSGVTVSQTLSTDLVADSTYTLSLAMADRSDTGNPGSGFTVQLFAGSTSLFDVSPTLTSTFTNYSFTYTSPLSAADIGQPLEIVFDNTSTKQALMDNVTLDVVAAPEPSTWVMMLGGLSLLGVYKHRRAVRAS
jgi:hypothetical protein